MSATVSGFGRRRVEDVAPKPPPPPAAPEPVAKAAPATPAALAQVAAMAQLRALCLAQLDAATLAGLSPEKLAHEIERTRLRARRLREGYRRIDAARHGVSDIAGAARLAHDLLGPFDG